MPVKSFKTLTFLVFAQFAVTSLWFAGNAIYPDIQEAFGFAFNITPKLTIAVQLGFITGTLVYAIGMIPDRFSPAKVFLISSLLASFTNLLIIFGLPFLGLFASRFLVGFFLAGIYPVGMKIASDWFRKDLGNALGFLVGALVLGTAFPHFIKANTLLFSWHVVVYATSLLAIIGGLAVFYLVGDGPDRKPAQAFSGRVFLEIFKNKMFRQAALGYFGHMWELYAFWAFVPAIIRHYNQTNEQSVNLSIGSFLIISVGGLGCVVGGVLSKHLGSGRVAFFSLLVSASCGALSLIFFKSDPMIFLVFLTLWGFTVVADSPQFSTLVAGHADSRYIGSALTIVNCLGFAITILSIQLLDQLLQTGPWYWVLALGPILALIPTGKLAFTSKNHLPDEVDEFRLD